jgi:hypothetical protein
MVGLLVPSPSIRQHKAFFAKPNHENPDCVTRTPQRCRNLIQALAGRPSSFDLAALPVAIDGRLGEPRGRRHNDVRKKRLILNRAIHVDVSPLSRRRSCVYLCSESTNLPSAPIDPRLRLPRARLVTRDQARDSTVAGIRLCFRAPTEILLVMGVAHDAQVQSSIIKSVAISVIPLSRITFLQTKNQSVHVDAPASIGAVGVHRPDATPDRTPTPLVQPSEIDNIDHRISPNGAITTAKGDEAVRFFLHGSLPSRAMPPDVSPSRGRFSYFQYISGGDRSSLCL